MRLCANMCLDDRPDAVKSFARKRRRENELINVSEMVSEKPTGAGPLNVCMLHCVVATSCQECLSPAQLTSFLIFWLQRSINSLKI